ncbi:MAG: hypothetical protein KGJ23_06680 [Euryarchaeota archaeon]|nr:hypothetical protein [Euryarchaeota archaeon]MDE1836284.1 hypothetical protein [Euryarchaeota archaeon]MDE1880912.1 hypothetical protein [Euryarchaeota archaeon]MDE2044320.1 hypothetical protein [Thermoplasmata archaeon]
MGGATGEGEAKAASPAPTPLRASGTPGRALPTYRCGPVRDPVVPVLYVVVLLVVVFEFPRLGAAPPFVGFLAAVIALYLVRELSVSYSIDSDRLSAWRIFGWRRLPLSSIRRVEAVSLRDLSPIGFFGSWGWRSRRWSPSIGKFDSVYTFHRGLLVHTDQVPLFLSPKDREGFVKELSRRMDAAGCALEVPESLTSP